MRDDTDRSDADYLHCRNSRADRDDDLLQQEVEMDDTISRQAAIDAVNRFSLGETDAVRLSMKVSDYLNRLPSAQPEIIRCKDCKHQERFFHEDKRRKKGGYYIFGCELADGYSHVCLDDDYCSMAERRTDG